MMDLNSQLVRFWFIHLKFWNRAEKEKKTKPIRIVWSFGWRRMGARLSPQLFLPAIVLKIWNIDLSRTYTHDSSVIVIDSEGTEMRSRGVFFLSQVRPGCAVLPWFQANADLSVDRPGLQSRGVFFSFQGHSSFFATYDSVFEGLWAPGREEAEIETAHVYIRLCFVGYRRIPITN